MTSILEYGVDGTARTLLEDSSEVRFPMHTEDGTVLLSNREGYPDLYLLEEGTGALTRLTVSEGFDHFPTWSPDGRYLAFHSNRSGSFDLWVVPAAGGEAVQLTSGSAEDQRPAWSPDGTAIAFSSDRGGSMDIWTLSVPDPTGGPPAP